MGRPARPILERLLSRVAKDDKGCWIYTGKARATGGYGLIGTGNAQRGTFRHLSVHRVAYEALKGPIPIGLTLDHLCRTPECCNPEYLEPVTMRENILRGNGWAAKNARKTHCKRGHPFTSENTYTKGLHDRRCRACRHAQYRSRRRRPVVADVI